MGESILTVGGTAKVLAGGTTELNTALGILADNGVKGAEGGTALRNIILSLTAPTDTAARKMKELGLEVLDAEGNMRPLNDIFNDLNGTLSDMTQGEQTQVLNELFNKTDLKSVNALLANSGERFDELSAYIDDASGAAANMAETMNNNLKGKITQLGNALKGLGIEIYDSLKVGLQDAVDGAIASVGRLSEAFKNNGFDGLINEAGLVLSEFLVKIAEYAPQVVDTAIQLIQSFITAIASNLPTVVQSAIQIAQSLIYGIIQMLPQILQMGIDIIVELARGLAQTLPELIPVAIDAVLTLVDTLIDNIDTVVDAGIELIIALADGLIESLPNLIEKVPIIIGKLLEAIASNLPKLIEAGVKLVVKLAEGVVNAIPQLVSKIPGLISAVLNAIATFLGKFFESGSRISQRIGEGISSMTGALMNIGTSLIKSLIGAVSGAVSGFFNIGKNIVQGVWNGISSMASWITSKISSFFSGIVDKAKSVLGIHSPSRVFRDEVGKFMAEGVGVGFENETDDVKADMQASLMDLTAKMKATVSAETSTFFNEGRTVPSSAESKVNQNSGIVQNVTIVNPERSPVENARALKKVGRDLMGV